MNVLTVLRIVQNALNGVNLVDIGGRACDVLVDAAELPRELRYVVPSGNRERWQDCVSD